MTKPMVRIHNAETDEIIDREMTDSEFADYVALQEKLESEKLETETKRQALLAKLGITEEEAKLLFS